MIWPQPLRVWVCLAALVVAIVGSAVGGCVAVAARVVP